MSVWTFWRRDKSLARTWNQIRHRLVSVWWVNVDSVARHSKADTAAAVAKFSFRQNVTLPDTGLGHHPGSCCPTNGNFTRPTVIPYFRVCTILWAMTGKQARWCALYTSPINKFQIRGFTIWSKEINISGKTKLPKNVEGVADTMHVY
jgi:hypothetical protein